MEQQQIRLPTNSIVGEIFGLFLFLYGFRILYKKRLIQNVQTSTVRAISMGEVEIKGKVKAGYILKTPLSKKDCVFFRYTEEKAIKVGNSDRWIKTVDMRTNFPFYLVDETGAIIVDPVKAELNIVNRYVEQKGNIRKTEYYIKEDENLYILGKAKKLSSEIDIEHKMIEERLNEIMKNPQEKKEIDRNLDSKIDENELAETRGKIRQEIRNQLEKAFKGNKDNFLLPHLKDVIIGKEKGSPFIISTMAEDTLVKNMEVKSFFMIYGGAFPIIWSSWAILTHMHK